MIRKALTLAMTVAVAVLVGALGVMPTAAQQAGVSASRSFERETVAADAQDRRVEVTIVVSGPVGFADVVETLPDGFSYVDEPVSSDSTINVGQDGQDVTFTFNGATSFTYAVTAPSAEGPHDFSGKLTLLSDPDVRHTVGGVARVTVGTSRPTTGEGSTSGGGGGDAGTDSCAYAHGDAGTDSCAYAHGDAGTHGSTHGDGRADAGTHCGPDGHPLASHRRADAHGGAHGCAACGGAGR